MPFTPKDWRDSPSDLTTPITAAALEDMETRLAAYADSAPFFPLSRFSSLVFNGATNVGAALNAAITSIEGIGGGTLVLPSGVGLLETSVLLKPNVSIVGNGMTATVLRANSSMNAYLIEFSPPAVTVMYGSRIGDLKLECNGANQTAGGGINAKGAVACVFDHLWVNRPWANGLWLRDDNNGAYGRSNTVTDCLFDGGEDSNGGDGRALNLDSSDENNISRCTFTNNGRVGATERNHIYDQAGLNTVIGCSFVGGGTGHKLQGADASSIGNTFDGCKDHSLRVNGSRSQIVGNRFYHLGFTGTNIDGIWVDNVSGAQIVGNVFDTIATIDAGGGTCRSGINLSSGPATNAQVVGNRFHVTGMAYGTATIIPGAGAGHQIRNNLGFATESKGTAVVASGATTVVVTHGLGITPVSGDIQVTPTNNLGTAVMWWITTITATQFTINVDVDPGATTATFGWQVRS